MIVSRSFQLEKLYFDRFLLLDFQFVQVNPLSLILERSYEFK